MTVILMRLITVLTKVHHWAWSIQSPFSLTVLSRSVLILSFCAWPWLPSGHWPLSFLMTHLYEYLIFAIYATWPDHPSHLHYLPNSMNHKVIHYAVLWSPWSSLFLSLQHPEVSIGIVNGLWAGQLMIHGSTASCSLTWHVCMQLEQTCFLLPTVVISIHYT